MNPKSNEDRHSLRIAGQRAAKANPLAVFARTFHGEIDQLENRGMQSIELFRQARIGSVHRQRVLRKVVGADREEIALFRELLHRSAADAVSTMMPTGTDGAPIARSSSFTIASASRHSSRVAIIGNMIAIFPCGAARRIALTCTRRISG